jgi:hypothetical protein
MTISGRRAGLACVVVLLLIQFVPVDRSNPPEQEIVPAPPNVQAIFERSCYDCHSNRTVWPWYSRLAPISWLVANDVHEGRRHLNFTAWNTMSARDRSHAFHDTWDQVSHGDMPLWYYLPLHPQAKLSDDDKAAIHDWTQTMEAQEPLGSAPRPERPGAR